MTDLEFLSIFKRRPVVGDTYRVEAGAPGIGYTTYRITSVRDGIVTDERVHSTVRILSPEETR